MPNGHAFLTLVLAQRVRKALLRTGLVQHAGQIQSSNSGSPQVYLTTRLLTYPAFAKAASTFGGYILELSIPDRAFSFIKTEC
jgi:hypothetical protein